MPMNHIITSYHPDGKRIITFDEGPHVYKDNSGKIYESGTRFVGKYFNKFDMVGMAEKCSKGDKPKYKGRSPKEIISEWKAKGELASAEGTNIHLYGEGLSSMWPSPKLPKPLNDKCSKKFIQVEKAIADLNQYYQFIGAEVIVFSPQLGKSGTIDLLMWSRVSNEIVIFDWKTNETIDRFNQYQKALKPIDWLEETDIAKYSLQTSFYEYVMKLENYFPGVNGFRRALIHLTEDDYKIIPLEDYSFEIKEMLKYEGLKIAV